MEELLKNGTHTEYLLLPIFTKMHSITKAHVEKPQIFRNKKLLLKKVTVQRRNHKENEKILSTE